MFASLMLLLSLGPIPASGGLYTGCYTRGGPTPGAVRVIEASERCRRGEVPIAWNQDPLRAAQRRWYPVNESGAAFTVGNDPMALAFDGAHMWVANYQDGTVTKLRASDGQSLGTYPVGAHPIALAFDGANVWVANVGDRTVSKLRASDGGSLGTFALTVRPFALAFDGQYVWVGVDGTSVPGGPVLVKMRPGDGSVVASYPVPLCPLATILDLAADGSSIFINASCPTDASVAMRVNAADGSVAATKAGSAFVGMVFDGTSLWVASWATPAAVWKLRPSDLAVLCSYTPPAPTWIQGLGFDGLHVWVSQQPLGNPAPYYTIAKLDMGSCAVVGGSAGPTLTDVNASDGVNLWSACSWSVDPKVCKL